MSHFEKFFDRPPEELQSRLSNLLANGQLYIYRIVLPFEALEAGRRGLFAHQELLERFHKADVTGELDGLDAPPISQLGLSERRAS